MENKTAKLKYCKKDDSSCYDAEESNACPSKPKTRNDCQKCYNKDFTSAILIGDYSQFDDYISTLLLLKSKNIKIELIVSNYGFGNVGPGINNIYDLLAMFGDETTPVVAGTYYAPEEIAAGPNPTYSYASGQTEPIQTPPGPYEYPTATSSTVGQIAQPMYDMFIPPQAKELGSTLYGTVNMLVRNKNPCRRWVSNFPTGYKPYVPAEDRIAEVLESLNKKKKKAVIFNTGPHSDLGKFFTKYGDKPSYTDAIQEVIIMGGGFYNFFYKDYFCDPVNPNCATEPGNQRWAGNIYTADIYGLSPAFGDIAPPPSYANANSDSNPIGPNNAFSMDWDFKPPFTSMQEFNIFKDPSSAQIVFSTLFNLKIKTTVVPTDATDPINIANNLDALRCSPTPEGRFVYALIQGVKDNTGPDFDFIIKLWDVLATVVYLNSNVILSSQKGEIAVTQLGDIDQLQEVACSLGSLANPFNVLNYNPYVGQTKIQPNPNSTITVVTKINGPAAFKEIINLLNSPVNSSCQQFNYYLGEIDGFCDC